MKNSIKCLTINVRRSGYVELLNSDGVWIGLLGGFRSTVEAREWARANGYRVARSIRREA